MDFHVRDMRYEAGRTMCRHAHDELQISVVVHGVIREEVNGTTSHGAAGDVIVKPSGLIHANSFDDVRIIRLDAAPDSLDVPLPSYAWHRSPSVTAAAMRFVARFFATGTVDAEAVDLLGALAPVRDSALAKKAARMIEERFAGDLRVDALACELGVHRVYLARAFRSRWRCSPREYLQRVRLRAVMRELAGSARPLADIALGAGFSDQAHMSRLFSRSIGMTPGAFRRMARR